MKKINHWIFRQIFYGTLLLRREWFFHNITSCWSLSIFHLKN